VSESTITFLVLAAAVGVFVWDYFPVAIVPSSAAASTAPVAVKSPQTGAIVARCSVRS